MLVHVAFGSVCAMPSATCIAKMLAIVVKIYIVIDQKKSISTQPRVMNIF